MPQVDEIRARLDERLLRKRLDERLALKTEDSLSLATHTPMSQQGPVNNPPAPFKSILPEVRPDVTSVAGQPPMTEEQVIDYAVSHPPSKNIFPGLMGGALKGATLNMIEPTPVPEQVNPAVEQAGELIGSFAPLVLGGAAIEAVPGVGAVVKAATKISPILGGIVKSAPLGLGYGAARKPEQGETRIGNALTDAATFGLLGGVTGIPGQVARLVRPKARIPIMPSPKAETTPLEAPQAPIAEAAPTVEPPIEAPPAPSQQARIEPQPGIAKAAVESDLMQIFDNMSKQDLALHQGNLGTVGRGILGGESGLGIELAKNADRELNQVGALSLASKDIKVRRDARKVLRYLSDRTEDNIRTAKLVALKDNLESAGTPESKIIIRAIDKMIPPQSKPSPSPASIPEPAQPVEIAPPSEAPGEGIETELRSILQSQNKQGAKWQLRKNPNYGKEGPTGIDNDPFLLTGTDVTGRTRQRIKGDVAFLKKMVTEPSGIVKKLDTLESEAKERIKGRGMTLGSGPLHELPNSVDLAIIGAAKIARGTIKFAEWSAEMVKEFGDTIKPYLQKLWNESHTYLKATRDRLNLDRLDITPEAKVKLTKAIDEVKPELEKIKGETLTHEEVLEAAKSSDILRKVSTREQQLAMEAAATRARQNVVALAEGKELTPDFIDNLKIIISHGTEYARGLEAQKIPAGSDLANIKIDVVKRLLKLGHDGEAILEAAKGVDWTNAKQVAEFYRKFDPATLTNLIDEYRYINLLSSPKTHIVNTFSNIIQVMGLRGATRTVAGLVDPIAAKLSGRQRQYYLSQFPAFYRGMYASMGEAFVKAGRAMKGQSLIERPDIERIPTNNKILKPFYAIPRALEASDVFFRTLVEGGEREALVHRAKKTGSPINESAITRQAKDIAAETIFRKPLDPHNKSGQGILLSTIDKGTSAIYQLRKVPGVKWFVPFLETPMNILKQGIEYSPVGFPTMVKSKFKTEQFSKAAIGSMVFAGAGYLALNDRTTWAVPRGKADKEKFYAAGMQPYSIKIGDKWIGYNRLGPLSYPIAMAAAIKWNFEDNPSSRDDGTMAKIGASIASMGRFFSDQSYMEGLADIIAAVQGQESSVADALTQIPSQLIPLGSLQRWVAQAIDPIYRKPEKGLSPKAVGQSLIKDIPFLSKLLPAYEEKGKPAKRDFPISSMFSPVAISQSEGNTPKFGKDAPEQLYRRMVTAAQSGNIDELQRLKRELKAAGYNFSNKKYNEVREKILKKK